MFDTGDDSAFSTAPTYNQVPSQTFNKAPIVSNGLFASSNLKEEKGAGEGKDRNLNSIFDDEDFEEEKRQNEDLDVKMQKDIQDRKKTALFKIEEDDDDDFGYNPSSQFKQQN